MTKRVYNFNAGPATLPLEVLEKVQAELLDYKSTGMSVMESSHRSPEYDEINNSAMTLMKKLLGLDDSYKVLFVGGGASTQFAMVPMNLLGNGQTAAYVDTGNWSTRAIKEAQNLGQVHIAASTKEDEYIRVPSANEISFPGDAAYLHLTSNNTIYGTQLHDFPDTGEVAMICDMSSDIASRRLDFSKFGMIYAGAQKNLGPSGVTVVVIREELLARSPKSLPIMFNYNTHADKNSLYNTPPAFGVYILNLILQWISDQGGLEGMEKINFAKKERIYQVIDLHPDFFRGTVVPESRSWMNLTMRLPTEELEKKFIAEAKEAGFVGLKGHRNVGGIRVSMYNALPLEGADKLVEFMLKFKKAN